MKKIMNTLKEKVERIFKMYSNLILLKWRIYKNTY